MAQKMKAVRLHAPGDLRVEEVEIPAPGDNQVLVKVRAVGVCGSDPGRVMKKGTYSYPTIIGHEFAGEIAEVGDKVKGFKSGDRVTVAPLIPCGTCDYCKTGKYNLCDNYSYYGSRTDGAMAEYVVVEECDLLKLPDQVDFESGACTDPASIALHAMLKSGMKVGDNVAVLGVGPIGLFAVQWAKIMGAKTVFAVDIMDEKLRVAEEVGADYLVNAKNTDPVKFILDKTGRGVQRVIELAGSKITQEQSIRLADKEGTIVFCGISYDDLVIPASTLDALLRKEVRLVGAWNSVFSPLPVNEWELSLHFMARGGLRCKPLISHRFSLDEAPEVFQRIWARSEFFNKVLFIPN
ncbi:galactitol-1-phosphate 5-dehydrogenase [Thermatribacter velox]|uniref:Galactitol-1-phosphate 5-dehydrogenase n=1 Tax=Thermatribacter velox TaxID=3039681 RepID=A0ABZ2YAI0_9BACT